MFLSLKERLRKDVYAIKHITAFTDRARRWLSTLVELPEILEPLGGSPQTKEWQVYDHCAALTRLYAIYATFIEELASEYVELIPTLYQGYRELPESMRSQHRIGIAQILLKLNDTGTYGTLDERRIVEHLAAGIAGNRPYSLLSDAFLVDRQNYRLDVLAGIFTSLGITKIGARLNRNIKIKSFLQEKYGESSTLDAELAGFVRRRNEAAHSQIEDTIGVDDFHSLADLIENLCAGLAEIVEEEVIRRRVALTQFSDCGSVEEAPYKGFVAVARMRAVSLKLGDELLILQNAEFVNRASIESLRLEDVEVDHVDAAEGQEVGIRLSARCRQGNTLARLIEPACPPEPQMPMFDSNDPAEPDSFEVELAQAAEELLESETDPEAPLNLGK